MLIDVMVGGAEVRVIEAVIGAVMLALGLWPKAKFCPGRLGTRQELAPIEPSWVPRLFILGAGLIFLMDGIKTVRH